MKSFLTLAKSRYSSRNYLNKPVEDEKIMQILEAARVAPSAANRQPCLYYVIKSTEGLQKIKECYKRDWFNQAPVVIAICVNHNISWKRADGKDHSDIDVAIAVDHLTLAATDLGLATCWICNFDAQLAHQALNLQPNVEPVVLLPIAYPADFADVTRHTTMRKDINELVTFC